jgi:hypothetical protein
VTAKQEAVLRAVREACGEAAAAGELPVFLAGLEQARVEAVLSAASRPELPDAALTLEQAAAMFGEPPETFRRRPDVVKAQIRRPGERRLRYLRSELERILRDRLAANTEEL